jgi:hypothetical protein
MILWLLPLACWASGSCTSQNPAVNVVLAPGSNGSHLIYGDADFGSGANTYYNANDPEFNGGTIYSGGVFNVCSGSNDLTLNLNNTARFINVGFFQQLAPPASGTYNVDGQTDPMTFFNVHDAYSLQTVGGSLNTCIDSSVNYSNSAHVTLYFNNPTTFQSNGGVCGLPDPVSGDADPAVITVTHPDSCTWIVRPVADSAGYYRGDVWQSVKKTGFLSGGQYNLPFAMKVVLATPSCPLN